MAQNNKQRVTAFIDPNLVKRAKVRGALEGLTISEVIEKALDAYAPKLEQSSDQHIHVKFLNNPLIDTSISKKGLKEMEMVQKHSKALTVPRQ